MLPSSGSSEQHGCVDLFSDHFPAWAIDEFETLLALKDAAQSFFPVVTPRPLKPLLFASDRVPQPPKPSSSSHNTASVETYEVVLFYANAAASLIYPRGLWVRPITSLSYYPSHYRLVVIDLEDVKWLKRPFALEPTSGNARKPNHQTGCLPVWTWAAL